LLHSLPSGDSRRDVAIYISNDEGKTWNDGKIVVPRYSAYSSLCVLPDKTIGLYVEEREVDTTSYEMVFYRFPISYLKD
jgi:sialidase-1